MPDPEQSVFACCPICGRPADAKQRPFCSIRCADADLGRWLTGAYRVPGPAMEPNGTDAMERSGAGPLDPEDGVG